MLYYDCKRGFSSDTAWTIDEKLEQLGVSYEYKLYGDEKNVLGHVFHLDMRNDIGKQCNDEQCEWFRGFM